MGSGRASAAVHSSLKSMSSNSPGMQLAARHCYILEDPPDDKKEQVGSERCVDLIYILYLQGFLNIVSDISERFAVLLLKWLTRMPTKMKT